MYSITFSNFSQDILEGAISEKDSLIADLEMKGVLDESETSRCDALKGERDGLLNRLKIEVKGQFNTYIHTWSINNKLYQYILM